MTSQVNSCMTRLKSKIILDENKNKTVNVVDGFSSRCGNMGVASSIRSCLWNVIFVSALGVRCPATKSGDLH